MNISKRVKAFPPYKSKSVGNNIRMDKNESPYPLPKEIKKEVLTELDKVQFNRYPQIAARSLRESLADYLGVGPENVVVGSGSDEMIPLVLNTLSAPRAIITPPTFSMYRFYAELNQMSLVKVPLNDSFRLSVEKIKEEIDDKTIVFICSPNNPTGNVFPRDQIVDLLDTDVPLILDEAYWEFSGSTNIDLVESYQNLVVLRTFSKAYGIAGVRVGYAVSNAAMIDYMLRIKSPYNLNSLSMITAEVMLRQHDLVEDRVRRIIKERQRIFGRLGDHCYPSEANFLLLDLDAGEYLADRGIAVRTFESELTDKVRVTIGRREQNDEFLKYIQGYIADENS